MSVSVIIPVFNGAAYLAEAIDSVLQQTRLADEILVVDDGSTDTSREVARSFGDRVWLITQENGGPAKARNRGIKEAQGSILAFLDADDRWHPDKLEKQLPALADAELVFCMFAKFYSEDCPAEFRNERTVQQANQAGFLPSAFMCEASLFGRIGLLDETLKSGEFIDWFARARAAGASEVVIPEALVERRIHANNLTRETSSMQEYLQVIRRNLERRKQS